MDTSIGTLKDTFKVGYEAYEESKLETAIVWDLYHNRQWTLEQLDTLANRGQPAETFNVVKLFARMLLGYYSTVVNTAMALPVQTNDIYTAALLNDVLAHVFRDNSFLAEGDKIKLCALISGLLCVYITVKDTGKKDRFGRPIRRITLEYVPDAEIVLDPMSRKDDYSDARFIHRFKWLSEEEVVKLYGANSLEKLESYFNHLNIDEAEFEYAYNGQFTGYYRVFNNYLVVQTTIIDDDGKTWSIHWCGDEELYRKEVSHKEVKFPYLIQKLHTSDKTEHYGIFREVIESQKAINQALIKLQLMVNTQKVYVEEGAVDNIAEFTDAVNRVNAVVKVQDLSGIKIENMTKEVLDQYTVIDKAFDRIQRVLAINDSFLGMAFASDSGRKVKLQQNATITALRYLTTRIEEFYRTLGYNIASLARQYYTAEQALLITDETVGKRWVTLNQPMEIFTGNFDPNGRPEIEYAYEEVIDPATGNVSVDKDGNILIAPIPEEDTEIAFTTVDIEISTVAYNDEDEKNQLMMETILSGHIGQMLAQVNPAGFFQAASLSIKTMKTKHSPDIAGILAQTAQILGADPAATEQAILAAMGTKQQNQKSAQLKLPQNTNEGVG